MTMESGRARTVALGDRRTITFFVSYSIETGDVIGWTVWGGLVPVLV